MSVSYTYSANFGGKITVGLPKSMPRARGLDICDAVELLVEELMGLGASEAAEAPVKAELKAALPVHPAGKRDPEAAAASAGDLRRAAFEKEQADAAVAELEESAAPERQLVSKEEFAEFAKAESLSRWPKDGAVDLSQIVAFWNIGKSSFRARMNAGKFARPLELKGRSKASPRVWPAKIVGEQLAAEGYLMRGIAG